MIDGFHFETEKHDKDDITSKIPKQTTFTMENEPSQSSYRDPSGTDENLDDDYLDISEQKNRPDDTPIQQQRINAWHPILDPNWVIFTYLILAAIMVPFGT